MIIMPSNDRGKIVKEICRKYPNNVGMLNNPFCIKKPYGIHHAYDNGCFIRFDSKKYFKGLNKLKNFNMPLFVVAPDVVGCHDRTIALWKYFYPKLKQYNYPIAFVAQDGCTPEKVPQECDWIFIGGLDPWKDQNIHRFAMGTKPIHVGRVNSIGRLRHCISSHVNSVDGTGWFRGRGKNFYDLMNYFYGEKQCKLFSI